MCIAAPSTPRQPPATPTEQTPIDVSAWGAVYDLSDDEDGNQARTPAASPTAAPPAPGAALPKVALASIPSQQHPQASPLPATASSLAAQWLRHDGSPRRSAPPSSHHHTAEVGSPRSLKRQPPRATDHTCSGSIASVRTTVCDAVAAARGAVEMLQQSKLWAGLGSGLACHCWRGTLVYTGACALALWAQRGTVRERPEPGLEPKLGLALPDASPSCSPSLSP